MLFDAHTHLNYEELTEDERLDLAHEIEASDLAYMIDVGDCVASSRQALADADAYDWCYAAVGIHPDHASVYTDDDIEEIRKLAAHPKAVAIGEIGLDFYYGKDDQEEQQELFRKQIRLANELRMPIMIHSRDANQLTMDILKEEGAFSEERKSWFPRRPVPEDMPFAIPGAENGTAPDARVQMHCYSGSADMAEEYIRLGATISLGGPITFKNGKKAVEVFQRIPAEFIMSETDAPYMAPEPLRGRPNKPHYVEHIARKMAELKGLSFDRMCEILVENGKRFFGLEI